MKTRTLIIIVCALGVASAAVAILVGFEWWRSRTPNIENFQKSAAFDVENYGRTCVHLFSDYKGGLISRAGFKEALLQMTVPAIVKPRHLELILDVDAGREGDIEDMMREYESIVKAKP